MLRLTALAATAALAAAADWNLTASNVGQNGIYGIGVFQDALTAIIAYSDGIGYGIKRSADGGVTWNPQPNAAGYLFQLNSPAAYGTYTIVSGASSIQFSWNDGLNFSTAIGSNNAGGVTARKINPASPSGFAIVGVTQGNANGVVTSADGGLTWAAADASSAVGTNAASYGAFPSADVWYVTAQTQPGGGGGGSTTTTGGTSTSGTSTGGSTTAEGAAMRAGLPGSRLRPRKMADGSVRIHSEVAAGDAGYSGVVAKTTSGGSSFTAVYTMNGTAALAIDCLDENNCAFTAQDSQFAYIFTTNDGGNTWAQTLNVTAAVGSILTDIKVSGAGSYWAAGGVTTQTTFSPLFYTSSDSGKTWQAFTTALAGSPLAVTGLDCLPAAPGAPCWATLIDPSGVGYIAQYA